MKLLFEPRYLMNVSAKKLKKINLDDVRQIYIHQQKGHFSKSQYLRDDRLLKAKATKGQ